MLNVSNIASKIQRTSSRVMQKIANSVPNMTVSNKTLLKGIEWAGKHISSPQNRLILGVSALMSQPFIDLYNKRVDEDTRRASASRTIAKILAGTTSGFLVRYYTIKAVEKMTQIPAKCKKSWETFFTPSPLHVKISAESIGQYKNTIGTLLALGVMLMTNFLFDAPVTKNLTNKFIAYDKKHYRKNNQDKNHNIELNINTNHLRPTMQNFMNNVGKSAKGGANG